MKIYPMMVAGVAIAIIICGAMYDVPAIIVVPVGAFVGVGLIWIRA